MKYLYYTVAVMMALSSCTSHEKVILNDNETTFSSFPSSDSLFFSSISSQIIEEPRKILKYNDYLIINTFGKEYSKWIIIYSLKENQMIKKTVDYGKGPNEMLSCVIGFIDSKIWLYDITKKEIGLIPIDSLLLNEHLDIQRYKIDESYYSATLINDSTLLGTNNFTTQDKISYINFKNGTKWGKGNYSMLSKNIPLESIIDASSCNIDICPNSKRIALSYRYTDVLEIYTEDGNLVNALHGPNIFNIEFDVRSRDGRSFMAKNRKTRKAFVNSFVTNENIYLLYSGYKRNEKGWSTGSYIYVYSWKGKPLKSYFLSSPIYSFCVDEKEQTIYSYSMVTGELTKTKI